MTEQSFPPVLDVCCGSKSFWFDKKDSRALFVDERRGVFEVSHSDYPRAPVVVEPDYQGSFTDLPYPDDTFYLVVFDPPHLTRLKSGNLFKYYGSLKESWREDISKGFEECFRVLKSSGTLVFKWNEIEIKVSELLSLTPHSPLFGHKSGKVNKTHWIAFLKE